VWSVLITYSALATRQHVLLDALAGVVFGLVAFLPMRPIRTAHGTPMNASATP
jgi:hypothetical protein